MNIYIAGRYSRRNEFRNVRKLLEDAGHVVTSSWLHEGRELDHRLNDFPHLENRAFAAEDLIDIRNADAMLFFAEDPEDQPPRGGRHVEFGYALGLNKRVYVLGGEENIFHYLEGVTQIQDLGCLLNPGQ